MAQLSKKNPQILNDLPTKWSTRKELIAILIDQPVVAGLIAASGKTGLQHPDEINVVSGAMFVGNGMQLTKIGCSIMCKLYSTYRLANDANLSVSGRLLIHLSRIITKPWHLSGQTIYLWDQHVHFEIAMFDGDLHRFVDFRSPR